MQNGQQHFLFFLTKLQKQASQFSMNLEFSIYIHPSGCTEHQTEFESWESEFGQLIKKKRVVVQFITGWWDPFTSSSGK